MSILVEHKGAALPYSTLDKSIEVLDYTVWSPYAYRASVVVDTLRRKGSLDKGYRITRFVKYNDGSSITVNDASNGYGGSPSILVR